MASASIDAAPVTKNPTNLATAMPKLARKAANMARRLPSCIEGKLMGRATYGVRAPCAPRHPYGEQQRHAASLALQVRLPQRRVSALRGVPSAGPAVDRPQHACLVGGAQSPEPLDPSSTGYAFSITGGPPLHMAMSLLLPRDELTVPVARHLTAGAMEQLG